MNTKAREATVISKLRFRIPPVGGKTPDSIASKKAELADRVADFIERAPLMFGDRSGVQSVAYVALCNTECMVRICFYKPNFVASPFRGEFYRREMGQM